MEASGQETSRYRNWVRLPFMDTLSGGTKRTPQRTSAYETERYSSPLPANKKQKLNSTQSSPVPAPSDEVFEFGTAISKREVEKLGFNPRAQAIVPFCSIESRGLESREGRCRLGTQTKRPNSGNAGSAASSRRSSHTALSPPRHYHEVRVQDQPAKLAPRESEQDAGSGQRSSIIIPDDDVDQKRPIINLTEGFDQPTTQSQYWQPMIAKRTHSSSARTSPPPSLRSFAMERKGENLGLVSPSRDLQRGSTAVRPKLGDAASDSGELRRKFKRDNGDIPVCIDSDEDELNGPTNMGARVGSSNEQQFSRHDKPRAPRSPSPSDIAPTLFSCDRSSVVDPGPNRRAGPVREESVRISLNQLVSPSIHLRGGGIDLVWDSPRKFFHIMRDGTRVRLSDGEEDLSLGPKITSILINEDTTKVVLKASADSLSRGMILIDFQTQAGKREFIRRVSESTQRKPGISEQSREHIKGVFQKQTDDWVAHTTRPLQHKLARQAHEPPGANQSDDEKIVYESDQADDEPPAKVSSRMTEASSFPLVERESQKSKGDVSRDDAVEPSVREGARRGTRRSVGVSQSVARVVTPPRWTQLNDVSSWRNPVIYPPLPALRRVTVNVEDLARLDEGEFLNDTILSFALREIEESMDTRRRQEIHMFNTFFYTALSTKLGRKAFNFEAVKKWTNKVNIFEFPYVVVPINVSQHWFVAIIYNLPSMVAQRQDDNAREAEYSGQAEDTEQAPFDTTKVEEIESSDSGADIASSQTPNTRMSQLSIHDDDHRILGKRATQQAEKPRRYGAKKRAAPVRKCNALGPVIITLDSLGLTRSAEIRYLKDYIVAEANDKLGIALSPKDISGWTAKSIPQQTNFCDCGVLVVEYIRALAQDPHGFVKEMLRLAPVDHQRFDGFTASAMREKLRDGLLELSKATEEELKAKKAQKVKERQALRQTANHNPPATLPTEPGEENQGIPERPTTSEGPVSADLRLTSSPTIHASQQQRDAAASSPHSPRGSDIPLSVPSSQNRTASRTVDSFGVQTVRLPKHGSAFR